MGHDAIHLYEQHLHTLRDDEVMKKAKSEDRILLTMDIDFAGLTASSQPGQIPLVVIFRLSNQHPSHVQLRLQAILPTLQELHESSGAIISVSDTRVRIRQMPMQRI